MNVMGKVGSLITQGVYSVATPFHPFGGAVDIIVVKQQDGSFRSTPWYVRFGKFQGVLKGAEKMVRIDVNGVEANFHMYLDNSGEAYFITDVSGSKESESNGFLKDSSGLGGTQDDTNYSNNANGREEDTSVSNKGEVYLQDGGVSSSVNKVEGAESGTERMFYEVQDELSSLEDSVEFSEYGSSRYENLDSMDHLMESDNLDLEVIMVSVDGHILTAPILSSEGKSGNVNLDTPQFHLGPGEGTDFCEGDSDFSTGEATWTTGYIRDLGTSTSKVASENICNVNNGSNAFEHLKQDTNNGGNEERESFMHSNFEEASPSMRREDTFKSCLELQELTLQVENTNPKNMDTVIQRDIEEAQDEDGGFGVSRNSDGVSPSNSDIPTSMRIPDQNVSDGMCIPPLGDYGREDHIGVEVECNISRSAGPPTTSSCIDGITDLSTRLDISLCGNLLSEGMGSSVAAEIFDAHRISEEEFKLSSASIIKDKNLVVRFRDRYLPWDKAARIVLGMAAYGLNFPVEPNDAISVEQGATPKLREDDSGLTSTPSGRRWRLWPIPFRRVKTIEHTSSYSSSDSECGSQSLSLEPTPSSPSSSSGSPPQKQLIRTNVPTIEQISSLNLKEGQNLVTFSFSTMVLGMQKVEAHVYLWRWNARIVISDVDGTITKSDVLGQFMPLVGKDWTQSGVARLFSAIKENGYQLLFLSARAIVQAYITRNFLVNLKQDGKALPRGPVVISPDGLFPSLYREVIRRAPHEFKIACLEDIKALFPSDYNPFYAGFGNRDTDELSYRKIGIPKGKIFIINPKGEVAINCIKAKSYISLHTLVNDMFPPTSMIEQEDYNSWNYWKMPLPDMDNL